MKQVESYSDHDIRDSSAPNTAPDIRGIDDLKARMDYLNRCFLNGVVPGYPETHSALLDDYFRNSFGSSEAGLRLNLINNPYAIIATGGYGRNEVCRNPDVSVLFIFKHAIPEGAVGLIRDIVYPLWDLGFNINYTTRTVKECILNAGRDYSYLSTLVDARFICGASLLYTMLTRQLREKILFSRKKEIIEWYFNRDLKRHRKFGSEAYLPEPDLVYSPGGLKDFHSMFSALKVKHGPSDPRDLEYQGYLSWKEYEALNEALGFLRTALRFLHILTGRKNNRLMQKTLGTVAGFMDYAEETERFNSDLSRHMLTIECLHKRFYMTLSPELYTCESASSGETETTTKWLTWSRGQIDVISAIKLKKHPSLLLDIYSECDATNALPGPMTLRLIQEIISITPGGWIEDNCSRFEDRLFSPDSSVDVLFSMIESGLIQAFIPEFNVIRFRKRSGFYHVHPMCHHALHTVYHMKRLLESRRCEQPFHEVVSDHENRRILLWAALLHNLKHHVSDKDSVADSASIAHGILTRFGKTASFIRRVQRIIETQHLLDHAVTFRDVHAPSTRHHCRAVVGQPYDLLLLYLFTVADLRATGPAAWNRFKENDLDHLLSVCIDTSSDGTDRVTKQRIVERAMLEAQTHPVFSSGATMIPDACVETVTMAELSLHLSLAKRAFESGTAVSVSRTGDTRCVTLAAMTASRPLSTAYTVLTLHSITVYDCRIFIWENQVSLYVFRVSAPKDDIFETNTWARINNQLCSAISGENRINPAVYPCMDTIVAEPETAPCIRISKPSHSIDHTIEIHGRIPAYRIINTIRTIEDEGLSISFLRLTEGKKGPLLVLHINRRDDERLTRSQIKQLTEKIGQPQ